MQATDAIAAPHAPETDAPRPRSEVRLQRNLKLLAFGLGFLIFAGLAAIVGRVIYLASSPATQPAAPMPAIRPAQSVQIPPGAQVHSISLSGNRLAVHYEAGAQAGIAVIDLETGRTVANVAVQRGAGE